MVFAQKLWSDFNYILIFTSHLLPGQKNPWIFVLFCCLFSLTCGVTERTIHRGDRQDLLHTILLPVSQLHIWALQDKKDQGTELFKSRLAYTWLKRKINRKFPKQFVSNLGNISSKNLVRVTSSFRSCSLKRNGGVEILDQRVELRPRVNANTAGNNRSQAYFQAFLSTTGILKNKEPFKGKWQQKFYCLI